MSALAVPHRWAGARAMTLRDGTTVTVRALHPEDADLLRRMYERCSPETIYRRFIAARPPSTERMLRHLTDVDHCRSEALVALHGGEIVAVARYHATGPREAEIAIEVEDAWQRRGIARRLLVMLTDRARARGVAFFTGSMLADNRPARDLMASAFPVFESRIERGELSFRIPLGRSAVRLEPRGEVAEPRALFHDPVPAQLVRAGGDRRDHLRDVVDV